MGYRVCVLSTWFGDICCSRRDFCTFYKRSRSLYFKFYSLRLLTQRPPYYRLSPACKAAIGCRHSARRRQIAPFVLRCASLSVTATPAISILFLITLCSKKWYDICRTYGVVFIRFRGPRFHALVDIRLVTINRHARCSL